MERYKYKIEYYHGDRDFLEKIELSARQGWRYVESISCSESSLYNNKILFEMEINKSEQ